MPQFIMLLVYCSYLHSIYKLITNHKKKYTILELEGNLRNDVVQLHFTESKMKWQEMEITCQCNRASLKQDLRVGFPDTFYLINPFH